MIRCRYRQGYAQEIFLVPGEVAEIEVDLWDTAYTFRRGNEIRLEISSSNFPRFDRNPNTDQRIGGHSCAGLPGGFPTSASRT
jgi:uncharacterized protein